MLALAFVAFGPAGIRGMTGIEEVRAAALAYLPYLIASPLISVWAFLLDGVFIGATRTAEMRNGMAVSLLAFWLAAWLLMPLLRQPRPVARLPPPDERARPVARRDLRPARARGLGRGPALSASAVGIAEHVRS